MQEFSGQATLPLPRVGTPKGTGALGERRRTVADGALVALFCAAVFVGAGLVFLIEPMIVKMVLPKLGGSPSVWNTSLVFFQALLLAGYGYAHVTTRVLPLRRQAVFHLAVLALPLAFLPIALPSGWVPPDGGSPARWLVAVLGVAVGVPFLVVTTASPLLQKWFSDTSHPLAHDPYFLYAAGNAGSLAGLLGYPLLVEPHLTLAEQGRLWAYGYVLFAVLTGAAVVALRRSRPSAAVTPGVATAEAPAATVLSAAALAPVDWRRRGRWIALGAVPSSLMMGVTTYLSTDVAAVPLLWVVPLGVYLLTFILTFGRRNPVPVSRATTWMPYFVAFVAAGTVVHLDAPLGLTVGVNVVTLFFVGMLCHGRLAEDRPSAERLTEFFFLTSVGGVVGGICNALIAPLVFTSIAEYPLALLAALLLRPVVVGTRRFGLRDVLVAIGVFGAVTFTAGAVPRAAWIVAVLGALALRANPRQLSFALGAILLVGVVSRETGGALYRERTFFGALKVTEEDGFHVFSHGTTVHGKQRTDPAKALVPSTYYHPTGPLGQAFASFRGDPRLAHVGAVGLGTGAVASYAESGQRFTFFEIDDAVIRVARNSKYFTYLSRSDGRIDTVLGDARLSLAKEPDRSYGMLVLDAFSSDSIPVHLLTTDAMRLYERKLGTDPLIVLHISNRYLDLEPVVGAIARDVGLDARLFRDHHVTSTQAAEGKVNSTWVVLGKPGDLRRLEGHGDWRPLRQDKGVSAWTDDYSNVLDVLRYR